MDVRSVAGAILLTAAVAHAQDDAPVERRPRGTTIGIGAGWTFPQSILEPNTVSVRFRFARLALEPSVRLGGTSNATDNTGSVTLPGQSPTETEDRDRDGSVDATLGTGLRLALAARGPVDLLLLGGLSLGFGSATTNANVHVTDQLDRTTTSTLSVGASWGLGLEWFFKHNLSVSADAQNPLLTFTRRNVHVDREQPLLGDRIVTKSDSTTTSFEGAAVFRPVVRLMVHLYF